MYIIDVELFRPVRIFISFNFKPLYENFSSITILINHSSNQISMYKLIRDDFLSAYSTILLNQMRRWLKSYVFNKLDGYILTWGKLCSRFYLEI